MEKAKDSMSTFERRAWQIAGLILLVWAILFSVWLNLTPT